MKLTPMGFGTAILPRPRAFSYRLQESNDEWMSYILKSRELRLKKRPNEKRVVIQFYDPRLANVIYSRNLHIALLE